MNRLYLGIDPGSSSGCIVGYEPEKTTPRPLIIYFGKETLVEWYSYLESWRNNFDCVAVLEKVHGLPGTNVSAVSAFMKNVGHIEMALVSLRIPFAEVTPQTWMKYYNLKKEKTESKVEWKRRLREHLQRIMPDFKVTNDNADAMLIAYYNFKINGGK